MNRVCQEAVELVKRSEGLRLTAYLCPAGVPTIGWGHTRSVTMNDVRNKRTISQREAEALLAEDLAFAAQRVEDLVSVPLSDQQLGALVSYCLNLGDGNLGRSTLLRKLNQGDPLGAAQEFDRWVWARVEGKPQRLPGLVTRRAAEKALFLSGGGV